MRVILEDIPSSLNELRAALQLSPRGRLAVPLCGYPDPDSMAAAWALAELAAREGVQTDILHVDPVSHTENRLMLRELGVPLLPWNCDSSPLVSYDWFAVVDANVLDSRYAVFEALPCLCVWDHHGGELALKPKIVTVSHDVGSTSTLAVRYLDAAGLLSLATDLFVYGNPPPGSSSGISRLATALLIGIATDTDDYLLAQTADFAASAKAMAIADRALFRRIHRRAYSVAAMEVLQRALESVTVRGAVGVAWVGSLPPILRDSIPQAADLLVSRLDIDTVVVFGHVGSSIDGSVRTLDPNIHPAELISRALHLDQPRTGVSGGGREGKGGFRWHLDDDSPRAVRQVRAETEEAFLREAPAFDTR